MINPHAHHSVFKKGRGKKMREYLDESKDILEKYDIDWYRGPENLGWAPNKNHSTKAAKAVRDYLKEADKVGATKHDIVKALEEIKKHFANDTIHKFY
ncbi:Rhs family protein [Pseudoalteromonas sp. BMB]|nr:Rhs family protein [Pseudoalteromonas sp. BMB]